MKKSSIYLLIMALIFCGNIFSMDGQKNYEKNCAVKKKRRVQVKVACRTCRKHHKKCNDYYPCDNCSKLYKQCQPINKRRVPANKIPAICHEHHDQKNNLLGKIIPEYDDQVHDISTYKEHENHDQKDNLLGKIIPKYDDQVHVISTYIREESPLTSVTTNQDDFNAYNCSPKASPKMLKKKSSRIRSWKNRSKSFYEKDRRDTPKNHDEKINNDIRVWNFDFYAQPNDAENKPITLASNNDTSAQFTPPYEEDLSKNYLVDNLENFLSLDLNYENLLENSFDFGDP